MTTTNRFMRCYNVDCPIMLKLLTGSCSAEVLTVLGFVVNRQTKVAITVVTTYTCLYEIGNEVWINHASEKILRKSVNGFRGNWI